MNGTQAALPVGPAAPAIRRASAADLPALSAFFAGLSAGTMLLRFFAPVRPSRAMLSRLCGDGGCTEAVIASHRGTIIGHAMAVDVPDPASGPTTDIGVVVADAWQRRGVGSALMRALISGARGRGVTALRMDVLPGNRQALAMIAGHWPAAYLDRAPDCLTIRAGLPAPSREASAHPQRYRITRAGVTPHRSRPAPAGSGLARQ